MGTLYRSGRSVLSRLHKTRLYRVLIWCAVLLLGLPLMLAGQIIVLVLVFLNVPQGRDLIVERLPALTGGMVRLEGVSGALPWRIGLKKLTLQDSKGVWLELDDAALRWSPLALLHMGVKVESLTASRFSFVRLPVSAPEPEPPAKDTGPLHLPLSVRLDRLAVPRIEIGKEVFGQKLLLSLQGKARIASIQPFLSGVKLSTLPAATIVLKAQRLDDPAALDLSLTHRKHRFDGHLHYKESAHGFAGSLGHMPNLDPLETDLVFSGPLRKFQTHLTLQAGAGASSLHGKLKGTLDLKHLKGNVALVLTSGPMILKPDIGWEKINLAANLQGAFSHPWGDASLEMDGLAAAGVGANHIALQFTGRKNAALPEKSALVLQGAVTGLRLPSKPAALLASSPLSLKASYEPLAPQAPFEVAADHALFHLKLDGRSQPALAAHLSLALPTLAPFGQLGGIALAGQDALEAGFALPAKSANETVLTVENRLSVTGGLPQAVALIGPKSQLSLAVARSAAGVVDLSKLTFKGSGLELKGRALYDPRKSGAGVEAALRLTVPDFQKALPALRGGGVLSLEASGPVDDLGARLALDGTLGVHHTSGAILRTGPFALSGQVEHLPRQPEGKLSLTGTIDDSPLALEVLFSRDVSGNMVLDMPQLHWKTLQGGGQLALSAGRKVPDGDFDLKITQLVAFKALVGQPLSGHLALSVHTHPEIAGSAASLTSEKKVFKKSSSDLRKATPQNLPGRKIPNLKTALQKKATHASEGVGIESGAEKSAVNRPIGGDEELVVSLSGDAALPHYGVRQLKLEAKIRHLPSAPVTEATFTADGVRFEAMTGKLQAHVAGPLQALAARISGRFFHVMDAPAELDLAALANIPASTVRLDSLTALVKKERLRLLQPVTFSYGATTGVDHLRLSLAPPRGPAAMLVAAGEIKPTLGITFDLTQLTPALAAPFAPKLRADGMLNAHGQLKGTLAAPTGNVTVEGKGLRFQSDATVALPPASLLLRTDFQGQKATLTAQLDAGKNIGLQASGTIPLAADAPLNVAAKGHMNLSVANAVLGASGMGTSGALTFDFGVRGTRVRPLLTGGLQLRNGTFDQYAQGVHLTGITGDVVAENDVLEIKDFLIHAGDGTMDLKGNIGVLRPGIPVALTFTAHKAQPIHSDILTATIDAALHIAGQAETRVDVDGTVTIPQAAITIPNAMPASVPQIEIVQPVSATTPRPAPPLVIGLNVNIVAPGEIFVRGHGVFAVMGGKIHVGGTSASPNISGGFTLRRGTFNMAGISLNFTRGRVAFNGAGVAHKLDPTIDFRADRNANGTLASLIVTGYASDPKLKFVSNPPFPQDDVLAMLLFGSPRASLSAAQLAELGAAVVELGGGVSIDPLNAVRHLLGLDELTIGGGGSVDKGGTAVEAGKYVMPGVFVGAREGLSGGGGTQAEVIIDLTKHLKLNTTVGTGGQVNGFTTPENDPGSSVSLSYGTDY